MLCDSADDPDIQRVNSPLPNSTVYPPESPSTLPNPGLLPQHTVNEMQSAAWNGIKNHRPSKQTALITAPVPRCSGEPWAFSFSSLRRTTGSRIKLLESLVDLSLTLTQC